MLTLLFLLYLRKLNRKYSFTQRIKQWNIPVFPPSLLVFFLTFPGLTAFAQENNLRFGVWKNKMCIGFIHIGQETHSQQTSYKVQSQINFKILFPIQITSIEKSVFNNGILTYSSIKRNVNDREKVNKSIVYSSGVYRATDSGRSKILHLDTLRHNLVTLYFTQPGLIKQVYCDNHQTVSDVVKMAEGKYKVTMPDGSYNIFYYRNGKCIRVDVNNPLYKVELHPKNI